MAPHVDIHAAWKSIEFVSRPAMAAGHSAVAELRRVYGDVVVAEFAVPDADHRSAYR